MEANLISSSPKLGPEMKVRFFSSASNRASIKKDNFLELPFNFKKHYLLVEVLQEPQHEKIRCFAISFCTRSDRLL